MVMHILQYNLVYNNKIDLEPAKCVTKRVRGSCHPALRLRSPSAPPLTVAAGDSLCLEQCALAILYPNDRLSGFAMATKTCRAAKLYQRPLNSMRSLSVLE